MESFPSSEDYDYGIKNVSFSEKIEFKNVSLKINNNTILDNISCSIYIIGGVLCQI